MKKISEIINVMIKGGYTEKQQDKTRRMRSEALGMCLAMVFAVLVFPVGMICLTDSFLLDFMITVFVPVIINAIILGLIKKDKSELHTILIRSFVISVIIFSTSNYITQIISKNSLNPKIETLTYNNPLEKKLITMYTKTYYQYAKKYDVDYKIYFTKKYPEYIYGYTDTTRKLIIINYNHFVKIKDSDFLTKIEYPTTMKLIESRNNVLLHELSHVVQIRTNGYCNGHGTDWLKVAKSMSVDTRNYEQKIEK